MRTNATVDVFLAELREATWYELKMKACNSAGCGNQSTQFATLDYDGSESEIVLPRKALLCVFSASLSLPVLGLRRHHPAHQVSAGEERRREEALLHRLPGDPGHRGRGAALHHPQEAQGEEVEEAPR